MMTDNIIQFPIPVKEPSYTMHWAAVFTHFSDGTRVCHLEGIEDYLHHADELIIDLTAVIKAIKHRTNKL